MVQEVELSSGSRRVAGSIPPWVCRSVLEQDTQPPIAPDELVGTLHGSQSLLVCECVWEWVNERHKLYSTFDKGTI